MNVTPIRPPAVKAVRKTVSADFADNACAQGLDVCWAHLLIIASHLLETGRHDQARVLTHAAEVAKRVAVDITPATLSPSTANECLERP